jgi:MGT family glycosyltransferase
MGALGRELIARGHRVTCFHMPDLEQAVRREGLEFVAIGASDHPVGSLPVSLARLARLQGLAALRFTIDAVAKTTVMFLRDAPAPVRNAGVDALIVDQMEPAGGAVAEHLGLPFVTVCNALAINTDVDVPPPFTPWAFRDDALGRLRNRAGYTVSRWVMQPVARQVDAWRQRWELPPLARPDDSFSRLAQICQMPRLFDFPRRALPPNFHYVGPLRRTVPNTVEFPWHRLDGRPLVYASLGTLQNRRFDVFRCFAEACRGLRVQLVLSHGGGLTDGQAAVLPGDPLVVSYAPQWELLARAAATITHAGLNTVLDSLAHGVPVVAIPITYEQPAIARRVVHAGCGAALPFGKLSAGRVRHALQRVLGDAGARQAAGRIRDDIAQAGGVAQAAGLVERLTAHR